MTRQTTVEQTAHADAKKFTKSGDHSDALAQLRKDSSSTTLKDAESAQKFWDTFNKDIGKTKLPELQIDTANGHVRSVKDKEGKVLFEAKADGKPDATRTAADATKGDGKHSPGLNKGEGPYGAFQRQHPEWGHKKTLEEARKVLKETGRKVFKVGEQFKVNEDGSVSARENSRKEPGNYVETTSKDGHKNKVREGDAKGNFNETDFDKEGKKTGSTERKVGTKDGEFKETKRDADGKTVSETTRTKNDDGGYTDSVTDKDGTKVTKYDKDGKKIEDKGSGPETKGPTEPNMELDDKDKKAGDKPANAVKQVDAPGTKVEDVDKKKDTEKPVVNSGDQGSKEKALEKPVTAGSGNDAANTKQFPSDTLFYKAMNANPEFAKANWEAKNSAQESLIKALKDPKVAELASKIPPDMLDAMAGDTKAVNDFLQKKGFDRLLKENPDSEAVAATLSIKRDWTAERSDVKVGDKNYAAIDKDSKIYNVDGKPVVELYKDPDGKKDGITVYAIPNEKPVTGQQAMEEAKKLIPRVDGKEPQDQGNVRIPMVDLNIKESLSFLEGMKGDDKTIDQAVMQTKFKMDEGGFDAKQALAISVSRQLKLSPDPKYTFNTDFTFVVAKDGQPIFVQPVTKESWRDPKSK